MLLKHNNLQISTKNKQINTKIKWKSCSLSGSSFISWFHESEAAESRPINTNKTTLTEVKT